MSCFGIRKKNRVYIRERGERTELAFIINYDAVIHS
jgi:hypothetical protein